MKISDRRSFLKMSVMAGALPIDGLFQQAHAKELQTATHAVSHLDSREVAQHEEYWGVIQRGFSVSPLILNLHNGISPSPIVVQEAVARYNQLTNEGPNYFMWEILDQGREPLRAKLAHLAGTSPEEIAINRNTTDGLHAIIFGLPLKAGDEVVGCSYDYWHVMQAYRQRQEREGIVYKQVSFDFPVEDIDAIVKTYQKAMTPKTKLVHITHVMNSMGQIMPVRQIADMAHAHGAEVVVDGAQSFGLLDFKITDLHCEYFATSLHKFLCAPVGTGMLWVSRDKIEQVWPLLGADKPHSPDIRKFEVLGTRSFALEQGVGHAIKFHESIGGRRKQERLFYLKTYWSNRVRDIKGVKLHTSNKPEFSCANGSISMEQYTPVDLADALFQRYKIHSKVEIHDGLQCVRITPNVYTTIADLDRFVKAVGELASTRNS
ncbi:Cysteine desulfurase [Acidisarcina polymorpha]|uniref:Cysteine desulfurase n=1 Tax=Acidisarcina polymorpha TaxID=2211140 RepID=A0A2Z5G9H1_9BACT|nr:aminotransferase class V-fold PLP-dependent enzyme [Acidisarcina polymorpha]AXC15791.1 Cysteine desulfurase [Acidisarcina polymorpha]